MPLLSIIIPVYNVEKYLEECLNSILGQNFTDYEVILVNNASTDSSGEICGIYASKYHHIRTIHLQKNILPGGARNVGLKESRGKYIHFCDSDDLYIENSFQSIGNALAGPDFDVLLGKFISRPEKGAYVCNDVQLNINKFDILDTDIVMKHIASIPNFLCTVWRFIVRREFLIQNNILFPEGYHAEDESWTPKILCKSKSFILLDKAFYSYRPRAIDSITASRNFFQSKSQLVIAFNLLKFLSKEKYTGIRKRFIHSRINLLIGIFTSRCDTFNREQIFDLSKIIKENEDVFYKLMEIENRDDLYNIIITHGPYDGLQRYCQRTVEKTLAIVRGKGHKDIYIFPTGNNGESTARILQNSGYKIQGFFDNSKSKSKCTINGLHVNLPNQLKTMTTNKLENIFIIISAQDRDVAMKIIRQVKEYGLAEDQLVYRSY